MIELKFTDSELKNNSEKNHKKNCVKCNKEFFGYINQKQCDQCRHKEKLAISFRNHCSKCGRHSHTLSFYPKTKEYLCSFCIRKLALEAYYMRNYGELRPKTQVCPVCHKKFEREPRSKGLRVYCSEDCKSKLYNERAKAKEVTK